MHEASHVNLHLLGAEWVVNIACTLLDLCVCILNNYLIFHVHELGDATIHPVLDHVDLNLNQIEQTQSQSKCLI